MSQALTKLPLQGLLAGFRQFTVPEYQKLIEIGIIGENDELELIEGWLVHKMSRNPPHDGTMHRTLKRLLPLLPEVWDFRQQSALCLIDSQPEPDIAIVRKSADDYSSRHPSAGETGLVIEVADTSLEGDREDKGRIYARASVERYWIINIPDRQVEVYEVPSGPTADPRYASRQDYRHGDDVPFVLDGATLALIPVLQMFG